MITAAQATDPGIWTHERFSLVKEGIALPAGFEAYARVFHSIPLTDGGNALAERVRWSDLAKSAGRVLDQTTTWRDLLDDQDEAAMDAWDLEASAPSAGRLPVVDANRLIAVLATNTATPDRVFYLVWTGWPHLSQVKTLAAPRLQVVDREMALLVGSISDAVTDLGDQESPFVGLNWRTRISPTIWWPDDKVWAVVSDIDSESTVVCGTARCIDALLADPELDVVALK